jgi:hypothetical protein
MNPINSQVTVLPDLKITFSSTLRIGKRKGLSILVDNCCSIIDKPTEYTGFQVK